MLNVDGVQGPTVHEVRVTAVPLFSAAGIEETRSSLQVRQKPLRQERRGDATFGALSFARRVACGQAVVLDAPRSSSGSLVDPDPGC